MCQTESYAEPMPQIDDSEEMIATHRLELHHICVDDLLSLFESPEDVSIYEGQPYGNPHRVLMDESGPLRWRALTIKSCRLLPCKKFITMYTVPLAAKKSSTLLTPGCEISASARPSWKKLCKPKRYKRN